MTESTSAPVPANVFDDVVSLPSVPVAAPVSPVLEYANPAVAPVEIPMSSGHWLATAAIAFWCAGLLLVLTRLGLALSAVARISRDAKPVDDPAWLDEVDDVRQQMGITREVRLLESPRIRTPLTWGWLRPVAMIPETAVDWSSARRRIVLLHELYHIRRGHWISQILASVTCALYWFNPLVWFAARRMKIEREKSCDEAVVRHGTRPSEYARHLLEIARTMTTATDAPAATVCMVHRGQLERRLMNILQHGRIPRRSIKTLLAVATCMAGAVFTLAAIELETPDPPVAPTVATAPLAPLPPLAPLATVPPVPPAPPVRAAAPLPRPAAAPYPAPRPVRPSGIPRVALAPTASIPMAGVPMASTTITHDGDDWSLTGWSDGIYRIARNDDGFRFSMTIEDHDDVEFSDDGSRIVSMKPGSIVSLRTRADGTQQRLDIEPGSGGELVYDWRVDGEERTFDAEAEQWMQLTLTVANNSGEASRLRGQESSLRGKISSVRGQESSMRGRISSIKGKQSSLRGQISSIHGQRSSLKGQISSIRGQVSSMRGQISSYNGQISSLNAQRSRTPSGDGESSERMRELADEMNGLVDVEIDEIKEQIREVERRIEAFDAESRVAEVERQLAELDVEGRVAEIERQIEQLDMTEIDDLRREIEEFDTEGKVRELEREIEELNAQERAERIEVETRPLYRDLKRLSSRIH